MSESKTIRPDDCLFILDGWTCKGYFAAIPGASPSLRFTYRPCTPAERSMLLDKLHGKSSEAQDILTATALAGRIESWDAKGPDKQEMPITKENIGKLMFRIFDRLSGVVIYGTQQSDIDPEWSRDDSDDAADDRFQAMLRGEPYSDAALDRKLGN
jgi:hypothetical protein